jgi:hypothetical protein
MADVELKRGPMAFSNRGGDTQQRSLLYLNIFVLFALSIFIVTFLSTFSLLSSIETGRLSIPPYYDDVSYLYWSQSVLHAAPHQSIFATAYQMLNQHSPLTTLFGVIGYSFIKAGDIGPYVAGASHLVLFLFACLLLLRRLPAMAIIGIACAIGSIPALSNFVTNFRPEPAWASLTSVSVIAFFALDIYQRSRIKQIGLGLLVGLAVVSKPSISPMTIVVLGAAFLASGLAQYREKRICGSSPSLRDLAIGAATVLAAALLVIVPIGAIIGREIYHYIVWVMWDIPEEVSSHEGFVGKFLFYSFGYGGKAMLGPALPVLLAIWALGFVYAAVWRPSALTRIFSLFVVVLVSYAIPSASAVESVWFGSAFDGILVISTVYLIALLYEPFADSSSHARARARISALAGMAGIGLFLASNLRWEPSRTFDMAPNSRAELSDRTERIWSVLRERELVRLHSEPPGHLSYVMTIAAKPISGYVINLYAVKEGLPIRDCDLTYARSLNELLARLPYFDYVVVGPSFEINLTGASLGDALRDALNARSDFSHIAALPLREPGTLANIYERKLHAREFGAEGDCARS